MPLPLQIDGIRAGLVQALNPAELLLQVGVALARCRELDFDAEMTEEAV
jgi:hypothetical protein